MDDSSLIAALADRAGVAAPMIDRAVISVFHAAGPMVGSKVRDLLVGAGLTSGAIVIDMAEFVAAGRLNRTLIDVRYRYGEVDGLDGVLADLTRQGLLTDDGPSRRLQDLCDAVLSLRHEVAVAKWDPEVAGRVADVAMEAIAGGGGPLLAAGVDLPTPSAPQARCHHALNLMRWARHGAHAAAWLTRGLAGDEITSLQTSDSPEARAIIEDVERDTNVWCVPMMTIVGGRFTGWIDDLARLVDSPRMAASTPQDAVTDGGR